MAQTRIKGVSVIHLNDFVREHHGEAGLEALAKALPPALAKTVQGAVAFEWYPLRDYVAAEKKVIDLFYGGDDEKAWLIGAADLEASVGTVYKLVFRALGPFDIMARQAKVIATLMENVTLKVEKKGEREVLVRFGAMEAVHPVYCHDLRGSIIGTLRACGIKESTVTHLDCLHKGASECVYAATW